METFFQNKTKETKAVTNKTNRVKTSIRFCNFCVPLCTPPHLIFFCAYIYVELEEEECGLLILNLYVLLILNVHEGFPSAIRLVTEKMRASTYAKRNNRRTKCTEEWNRGGKETASAKKEI